MGHTAAKLLIPAGLLLTVGCGGRSPLDPVEKGGEPVGGGRLAIGGQTGIGEAAGGAGIGGVMAAGGMVVGGMLAAGGIMTAGGTTTDNGGRVGGGGFTGGQGGYVNGGSGGKAGVAGGTMGGQAGFGPGGSPLTGGRYGDAGGAGGGKDSNGGSLNGSAGGSLGGRIQGGGSSGAGGGRPTGGTVGSACAGPAVNEDLIDDLDDGDPYIPSVNGRVGSWQAVNDGTPGGVMFPDPLAGFMPTETGDVCRKYAAFTKGSGFSEWGARMSFGLGSPYNAGNYTGITFWARIEPGTKDVIRVAFPDRDTHPDGGICQSGITGPTACLDHYGVRLTLSSAWTKYYVSWSQLTQDGWGLQGKMFEPDSLYEVIFQIPVNATFGLWIDDVAFTYSVDAL